MKKLSFLNTRGIIFFIAFLVIFDLAFAFGLSPLVSGAILGAVNKNTRAKISVDSLRIHPVLFSVTAGGIQVFDPDRPSDRMLYAKSVSARLDFPALLSKRVFLSNLSLKNIELELVKDASGGLNVERIFKDGQAAESQSRFSKFFGKDKSDWFGHFYERLKSSIKKPKEKKGAAAEAGKTEKTVVELPRGKKVDFDSPLSTLFRIKTLKLDGGKIVLNDRGSSLPPIEDIHVSIKGLKVKKSGETQIRDLSARGKFKSEKEGRFDVRLKQGSSRADVSADLKNMDLNLLKPFYAQSSPVVFSRGYLNLNSDSRIEPEKLDSSNRLQIEGYEMAVRNKMSLSGFTSQAIVEALNQRDHFELKFRITGSPDRPSFEGFETSLLEIVKDDLKEGALSGIKEKASEKFGQLSEKVKGLL